MVDHSHAYVLGHMFWVPQPLSPPSGDGIKIGAYFIILSKNAFSLQDLTDAIKEKFEILRTRVPFSPPKASTENKSSAPTVDWITVPKA